MPIKNNTLRGLTIGELSDRTGLSVSAIRHYETEGLVRPWRTDAGQRRFERADIRRLSFVMIAQGLGLSLSDIRRHLDGLPNHRTPNTRDWERISHAVRADLDARIAALTQLRDKLTGCIGCGCLSLDRCALYNPKDRARKLGQGPRYLLGDTP